MPKKFTVAQGVQQNLPREDWCTPVEILEAVRELGPISYDPCGNPHSQVGAQVTNMLPKYERQMAALRGPRGTGADAFLHVEFGDGLRKPFRGFYGSVVWNNNPFGREPNKVWARKNMEEGLRLRELKVHLVCLEPVATATEWFDCYWRADAICFTRRLQFIGAEHTAPFDTCLPYWGPEPARFVKIMERFGHCVRGPIKTRISSVRG